MHVAQPGQSPTLPAEATSCPKHRGQSYSSKGGSEGGGTEWGPLYPAETKSTPLFSPASSSSLCTWETAMTPPPALRASAVALLPAHTRA